MAMWVLLLLMATPVSASLATWSMDCGTDHLSYFTSPHISFFFINSKAVDHVGFCNKFVFCYNHGCLCKSDFQVWAKVGEHFCNLKLTQVGLHCRAGRKLLPQLTNEPKSTEAREEKKLNASSMGSKTTLVALPGLFLLCCALVCPCFRTRSKQTEHTALAKDPSSNSVSSFGVSSTSERMPGSPLRVPPSPLRVPPSPLRVPPSPSRFSASPQLNRVGSIHLNMNQVNKATRNFSPSLKIGEGGFGTVYRAQLQDGQVVAVKRANKEHFDALHVEFSSEVDLLAKIEHRNLVKLLGYVKKGNERLIITEYVPNGTLREHLDGQHGKVLDFNQRLEIAIDVAHALTYLHLYTEKSIIHRDVKSSNILLTESLRAKVADFGFARLGPSDVEQTHISTKVKGTVGYLDPEYLKTYQLTPKSDVYSFGILLIEIFSARRPVDLKKPTEERVTVRWAFKNYNEGKLRDIMDPLMEEEVDMGILSKLFSLAFQCAAPTRSDRPSMKEVGEQLWGIRSEYYRTVRRP